MFQYFSYGSSNMEFHANTLSVKTIDIRKAKYHKSNDCTLLQNEWKCNNTSFVDVT